MNKTVVLVGHCGADNAYLRVAVQSADRSIRVVAADDQEELTKLLSAGIDLVLVNRELGWGFDHTEGLEIIRSLGPRFPQVKMMLISNYAEAQAQAVAAGALPGFGKREIGSPRVKDLLRAALNDVEQSAA